VISQIVNPRMMRSLKFVFNSLCTIQDKITSFNSYNEEVVTFSDNQALIGIRCYREPASGAETRTPNQTYSQSTYILALMGYYPGIGLTQRAVVNSEEIYNIQRVVHDDTKTITFLTCEVVNQSNER